MMFDAGEILRTIQFAVVISSVTAPSVIQQALDAVVEQPAQPSELLVRGEFTLSICMLSALWEQVYSLLPVIFAYLVVS